MLRQLDFICSYGSRLIIRMFVAVERTAIPGQTQNNASSHYYYYSPNYTIYDTAFPSGRVPTSGTSMGMSYVFESIAAIALIIGSKREWCLVCLRYRQSCQSFRRGSHQPRKVIDDSC